ncbi:formate/nitrite transporter family protein [Ktedonosporobacter rubrisoli]|uniref:Formate/nitrite transporter family protein n=1 Tax=Ktedonosporobacter rubrisoli TaxID=2509675 RepID=A0A4V0YYR1_KTERU|nr:formate/nitrite transporter family protein [Ktedonosporobacter rubrisoli]QBD77101.1 formate/nitrite transporter family protein [Ktedonosporobacter rubrisoli]
MDDERRTVRTTERFKETPEPNLATSNVVPPLNLGERKEVIRRKSISAIVIHEAIRENGERELRRSPIALAVSGLGAGLSMGFSLVTQGLLHTYLPAHALWTPLLDNLGYSVGFLIVILGRKQLFTENTLTAILPLLANFNRQTLWKVARLWLVVLIANLVGALIFAWAISHTNLFQPELQRSFAEISHHSLRGDFGLTVLRGIFAGWLIALMVWLLPAVGDTKFHVIILITYIVSLGGFAHIIAGSVDVLYLVNIGAISWLTYLVGFMLPTLIGNILGGVSLVAALNFAQVATEKIGGES